MPALVLLKSSGHATCSGSSWHGARRRVAAAVGPLQARVVPRLPRSGDWVSRHRDLGPRYLAEGTANSASSQLRNYGLGRHPRPGGVGYVQAAPR